MSNSIQFSTLKKNSLLIDEHTMVHVLLAFINNLLLLSSILWYFYFFQSLFHQIHSVADTTRYLNIVKWISCWFVHWIENANDNKTNKLTRKHNVMSTNSFMLFEFHCRFRLAILLVHDKVYMHIRSTRIKCVIMVLLRFYHFSDNIQ